MMRLPPGAPITAILSVGLDEARRHRTEHALAGLRRVGVEAHHAERVGRARPQREVVHLVVEQHAGAGRDHARAVQQVHGLRRRRRGCLRVDDREVRGLVVFQRRRLARQQRAGRGLVRMDAWRAGPRRSRGWSGAPAASSRSPDRPGRWCGRDRRGASLRRRGGVRCASSSFDRSQPSQHLQHLAPAPRHPTTAAARW